MSSTARSGIKSKKKYSGALFLENDEFDCFADQVHDGSSEEINSRKIEPIKPISRKESAHMGMSSAGRKFSKRIEEEKNEESEADTKQRSPQKGIPETSTSQQSQYGTYSLSNNSYAEQYKNFFPTSANNIGMNSISSMNSMHYMNQMSSGMNPMGFSATQGMAMNYGYGNNGNNFYPGMDMYASAKPYSLQDMTDQEIIDNFDRLVQSQPECKLIQLRLEREHQFFDLVFDHMIEDLTHYCTDSGTNFLALKVVEIAATQVSRAKRIVAAFEGKILKLCMDPAATRIVQKLIEKIFNKPDLIGTILEELKGKVTMLVMCNNGNHVIQKLISQSAPESIDFVYQEILDRFKQVGVHKHGCCVIQRCIDYASPSQRVSSI